MKWDNEGGKVWKRQTQKLTLRWCVPLFILACGPGATVSKQVQAPLSGSLVPGLEECGQQFSWQLTAQVSPEAPPGGDPLPRPGGESEKLHGSLSRSFLQPSVTRYEGQRLVLWDNALFSFDPLGKGVGASVTGPQERDASFLQTHTAVMLTLSIGGPSERHRSTSGSSSVASTRSPGICRTGDPKAAQLQPSSA